MKILCSPKNLYLNIYISFICKSPKLEKTQMSFSVWTNELWNIQTMEYYSVLKINEHWYIQQPDGSQKQYAE